jgi:hypothetical protein
MGSRYPSWFCCMESPLAAGKKNKIKDKTGSMWLFFYSGSMWLSVCLVWFVNLPSPSDRAIVHLAHTPSGRRKPEDSRKNTSYILPPFYNIRYFSFIKRVYLDFF